MPDQKLTNCCLLIVNSMAAAVGLMVLSLGLWALVGGYFNTILCNRDLTHLQINATSAIAYQDQTCTLAGYIRTCSTGLIVFGIGLSLFGLMGCITMTRSSRKMYIIVSAIMATYALALVIAGTIGLVHMNVQLSRGKEGYNKLYLWDVGNYRLDKKTYFLQDIQRVFSCCGANNYNDYGDIDLPPSCPPNTPTPSWGCTKSTDEYASSTTKGMIIVAFVALFSGITSSTAFAFAAYHHKTRATSQPQPQ